MSTGKEEGNTARLLLNGTLSLDDVALIAGLLY